MKITAKRGQAATEFIMTYGWAMLALIVAIGALAYFGVLNPSSFTSERCLTPPGFNCKDFRLIEGTAKGTLKADMVLENKEGIPVKITGVSATYSTYTPSSCDAPATTFYKADTSIPFSCTFPAGTFSSGKTVKVAFQINYTTLRGSYNHTLNSEINAKMQ